MTMRHYVWNLSISMLLQLFGLYLVLVGLIGVKKDNLEVTPIPIFNGFESSCASCYSASADQIALIVIDAMRVDFLSRTTMPVASALLDTGYGCSFISTVKAPTVTLPRIKALVTGDISTYWDIIQNFHSSKLNQDSFISHAVKDAKKKIVFYGDDTWMNLFPTEFVRSEGVTSFYVSDYTEVDNNVTRHLADELEEDADWDMLILHYLGLDHIGHIEGPKSKLVPNKLREMDDVVEKVYNYLKTLGSRSLLIVTGDHGMANVGGHGGNSYHERKTPFFVFSTELMKQCFRRNWEDLAPEIEQIDVATTLSALWGLILPSSSAGKYIPSLFGRLNLTQRLSIANYNAIHLLKFFDSSESSYSEELDKIQADHFQFLQNVNDDEVAKKILAEYENLIMRMSKSASEQLGEQNIIQMTVGILMCLSAVLVFYTQQFLNCKNRITRKATPKPGATFQWLNLIHYITPVCFLSSSFIEEEHYVRYYLWETGITCLLLISTEIRRTSGLKGFRIFSSVRLNFLIQLLKKLDYFFLVIQLLICNRIASAWNQTGQKWSHQEDLSDLIKHCELLHFTVGLSAVYLMFARKCTNELPRISFTCTVLVAWMYRIGIHREPDSDHLFNGVPIVLCSMLMNLIISCLNKVRGLVIFTNVWIILTLMLQRYENIPLIGLTVMMTLDLQKLFRGLLPVSRSGQEAKAILLLWFIYAAFFYQGNSNSIASIDVNAGYVGLTSYNETLVGLLIFCNTFSLPVLIILVYFSAEETQIRNRKDSSQTEEIDSFLVILCKTNAVTSLIYTLVIFIFRHHLFVWSVFAPKLLYVIAFTILYGLITLIYALICCIY